MVGLGVIGAGRAGALHVTAANKVEGVRYVGVAEVDDDRRAAFVARHGGASFRDYRDLLANDAVQLVVVALPHHLHADVTGDAARAGKNVLVEKPMATSLEECDRMIAAARQSGVFLHIGQTYHFHPTTAEARRVMEGGEIGEVVMGLEVLHSARHPGSQPSWIMTAAGGGGQLFSNGIHQVDRALWLVESRPVSVRAQVGTHFFAGEIDVDDASHMWIAFENGATVSILTTGFRAGAPSFFGEYVGNAGMLRVDQELRVASGAERAYRTVPVEAAEFSDGFVRQLDAVARAIERGGPAPVSGEWGREVLAVLLAAVESSRSGREVALA